MPEANLAADRSRRRSDSSDPIAPDDRIEDIFQRIELIRFGNKIVRAQPLDLPDGLGPGGSGQDDHRDLF